MSFIVWTADLETGFDKIDHQHRAVVDKTNRLHDQFEADESLGDLVESMRQILDMLIGHSRYEEELLEEQQYEYRDIHKDVHDRFNSRLAELIDRIESGGEKPDVFLETMGEFLQVHITTHDQGFRRVAV